MDEERHSPGCRVIRPGESFEGKQGLTYGRGISAGTAESRHLCMVTLELPPGSRARAHLHHGIETAVYVIEGEAETWFGESLSDHVLARAGDYIFIAADTPHVVVNRSDRVCRAVITHSAPDDQEGIEMRPELDSRVP
jgi:uncharacterized RmlC-like cupin family protein